MDKEKTGQLIKDARIKCGLTQTELGDMLGVTNKAVSRWENGESFPDVGILESLSGALHISIEEIVTGGEKCEDVSETLSDLINTVKLQNRQMNRQKRRQIVFALVMALFAFLSIYPGIVAYFANAEVIVNSIISIMISLFIYLLIISPRQKSAYTQVEGRGLLISLIPVLTGLYLIGMTGFTIYMLYRGQKPFGLEPVKTGPFLSNQFLAVFLINVCIAAIMIFTSIRENKHIRIIAYVTIGVFNLATCYTNMLRNMATFEGIWRLYLNITVKVIIVVVAAIIADLIINRHRKC